MNIFSKVTLRSLKKNKSRTIVAIIGIILSASMFTAVTTIISSMQGYMLDVTAYSTGKWHVAVHNVDAAHTEELISDENVAEMASIQAVGYAKAEGSVNSSKPYYSILGADDNFLRTMPIHLVEGRMPLDETEVLVPSHLASNGGVLLSLQEELMLVVGDRILDGQVLTQNDSYHETDDAAEKLTPRETRTYTVVGFYERPDFEPYFAPGYSLLTLADENIQRPNDCYVTLRNAKESFRFERTENDAGYRVETNNDYLTYLGVSRHDGFYTVLYGLGAILMALIMFGTISLIYNAFSISVSERTKQFGLLASIGATRKQLARSVFFEAACVSIVGIPIGILCGLAGISITLKIIGSAFSSILNQETPIPFSVTVRTGAILAAVAVALITVFISASVPALRAARLSAIDAIRQTKDIAVTAKSVKVSKLTYRVSGLEGLLAKKHFRRNRRRYRATVVSLFMSVVLFISASSFCSYLSSSVQGVYNVKDYDVFYYPHYVNEEEQKRAINLYQELREVEGVTDSSRIEFASVTAAISPELVTDEYEEMNREEQYQSMVLAFVDNETYERYLAEHNLDSATYLNTEMPLGIALQNYRVFSNDDQKYYDVPIYEKEAFSVDTFVFNYDKFKQYRDTVGLENINDSFDQPYETSSFYDKLSLSVGQVQETLSLGISAVSYHSLVVMYPMSAMDNMVFDGLELEHHQFFKASNHEDVVTKMETVLQTNRLSTAGLFDQADSDRSERSLVMIINTFSYGFIVLISLIAVANVFNTISTNILLRRREFAMLKSVGMTQRGFRKMMNYECWLYGSKALLLGLPVACLVTFAIYLAVQSAYSTEFMLPWSAIAVSVCSVFAVVFATMMYAMQKIKKDNPIDALKNENT